LAQHKGTKVAQSRSRRATEAWSPNPIEDGFSKARAQGF
jgi:hypothetical protein